LTGPPAAPVVWSHCRKAEHYVGAPASNDTLTSIGVKFICPLILVVVGLAACSGADSPATATATDARADHSSLTRPEGTSVGEPFPVRPGRDAFIYGAVIERLVKGGTRERTDYRIKMIFVLDGVVAHAADPTKPYDPEQPFNHELKDGIRFLAALVDLPQTEFVADREAAFVGTGSGRARGGVIVSLGPIEGAGNRVEVGASAWRIGLYGQWLTYVVEQKDGGWKVTGTTGPLVIS
jgi:hypothetical protein